MACSFSRFASLAALPLAAALAASPTQAWAQKAETVALCRAEKTERAIAACTTIIKGRGDRKSKASALLSRAQAYWALNRLAEAEKDYSETIKLAPSAMALYRDRGQIRFGLGNNAGAMADFTTALEMAPFDADNYTNRGYLKMLQYDFAGAGADLRQGLFWQKDHARSAYTLGLLHYSTGRYGDAVEQIDRARAVGFRGPEAFITKARSLFYLGTFDPAIREATEGLQAFPSQYSLTEIRARARLVRRDLEGALTDAQAVIQAAPRHGRAYATRAAIRLAMKDIAGATADADKAIELDPSLFDAHELKADILLASGNEAAARAVLAASAARTDAKMGYDIASRARHAARVAELDKPKPILVTDLDEAELKTRCGKRDDPLRMSSCDRLVQLATSPQAKAEMLLLRALARPSDGKLQDLDLAVEVAPDHHEARLARAGFLYGEAGWQANAAPMLERGWADADTVVKRAEPGSPILRSALSTRSMIATGLGRYESALADVSRLIDYEPDKAAWPLIQRADLYLRLGKPELALADARRGEALTPDDMKVYFGNQELVTALIELGQYDEADAALDLWKTRNPSVSYGFDELRGRVMLGRGRDQEALAIADEALSRTRNNVGARAVRGIASARLGASLDAISDLTAYIDEARDKPRMIVATTPAYTSQIYLHRGLARAQLNQGHAARADLTEAIRIAPDHARDYGERARLLLRADNPAALTDIAMALRIEPNAPRWQALAARIHLATGDLAAAERFAALALAAPDPEADLRLLRAKARFGLRNFSGAVEDATAHLVARAADSEALLVRIEARAGQGDLKAALADAEAARAARGDDTRILLALAELKLQTGDAPGAIGAFEEAAAKPDAALLANKRLGDLYTSIASDQLALSYYAKALEQRARTPEDEALRMAARTARDALIRKMAAPK
jgi:tetratricopeptide (TPR) repeat protein